MGGAEPEIVPTTIWTILIKQRILRSKYLRYVFEDGGESPHLHFRGKMTRTYVKLWRRRRKFWLRGENG